MPGLRGLVLSKRPRRLIEKYGATDSVILRGGYSVNFWMEVCRCDRHPIPDHDQVHFVNPNSRLDTKYPYPSPDSPSVNS